MQDADNGYMNEVEEEAAIPDYAYDYNEVIPFHYKGVQ